MKVFLDTANIEFIKKWMPTGLIDGVTTNPTHLSKEGGDPLDQVLRICELVPDGDISVEVIEIEPEAVYEQAKKIAALAPNIVVKVPSHSNYLAVINRLVTDGIRINITLLFSVVQALMMAKLGVTYISTIVGRLDDIDGDGIRVLEDTVNMVELYDYQSEVLAASLRSVKHIHEVINTGAHAITIPPEIFEKALDHPMTAQGMKQFDTDWQKLGVKKFP